ncbi:RNA-binding protein [Candidatus Bathyarchaeota archaeon ex4484_205]|nr:MAG: RNA-binding protein [Candidatus Bathyarchaeota archaeon ex4484_205]HDN17827.1 RNA-binding protein [Candidatus Bathyarchaeota archaeon]
MTNRIVLPGDVVAEGRFRIGENVYRLGNKIIASRVGLARIEKGVVSVIALHSFYMPQKGDTVIGIIEDIGITNWSVDINSPYVAVLPATSIFKRNFDPVKHDLKSELDIGDVIIAEILQFDRTIDPILGFKSREHGKVKDGLVVEMTPSKIPRLIGRKASMLNMIQKKTGCKLFIGQNGRVLIHSQDKAMIDLVVKVIRRIEREAHVSGLTDRISKMLDEGMERRTK